MGRFFDKTKTLVPKYLGWGRVSPKPFFNKLGFFIWTRIFPILIMAAVASPAHASLLSNILKLLGGNDASAKDTVSLDSATVSLPLLGSTNPISPQAQGASSSTDDLPSLSAVQANALVASRNPAGILPGPANQDQIQVYTVQAGDTLSSVAKNFDISLNTLLWANNLTKASRMKIGDDLIILPVSGVQYQVRRGDTIESIAKSFKGDVNEILSFNGLGVGEKLEVGSTIIIPDGELEPITPPISGSRSSRIPARFASWPDLGDYFMRPVIGGHKSQGIHGYNGVDLANTIDTPVMASAAGAIIVAKTSGWNGGYGRYVVITHPNGVQTLYAHLHQLFVQVGQEVSQGDVIGLLGSSGNSTGPHVHFEIRGAKNTF